MSSKGFVLMNKKYNIFSIKIKILSITNFKSVSIYITINYDKLQIIWSHVFTLLQIFVYIWSNSKVFGLSVFGFDLFYKWWIGIWYACTTVSMDYLQCHWQKKSLIALAPRLVPAVLANFEKCDSHGGRADEISRLKLVLKTRVFFYIWIRLIGSLENALEPFLNIRLMCNNLPGKIPAVYISDTKRIRL